MKLTRFILFGVIFLCFVTISNTQRDSEGEDDDDDDDDDDNDNEDEDSEDKELASINAVKDANRKFATNYYNVLRSSFPEGNLVYSPYSMSMLLAMLGTGSRDSTNKEIKRTLKLKSTITDEDMSDGMTKLITSLSDIGQAGFHAIQRIYVPSTHSIRQSFKDKLAEDFHTSSGVRIMNFEQRGTAAQKINGWIYQKTKGKIDSIISPEVLSKDTKLILISGVHVKGKWETSFNTKHDLFFVQDEYARNLTMMSQTGPFKYAELPELRARAVAIPYNGGRLELIVLLPNFKTEGIAPLENRLRNISLASIAARLHPNNVQLVLPEFKMETFIPLTNKSPMLRELGLNHALSHQLLQFNGITPYPGLYVDQVIQKTIFEINADGVSEQDAAHQSKPQIKFRADHPFLAFLFDTETETILLVMRKVD